MTQHATYSHAAPQPALDPIVLALVQNRLDYISRHMGWVMTRTARSPIFSQSHDFSCFLTDPHGTLISNADGVPIHTGGGGFAARALIKAFGDDIHDNDIFVLNDPYEAGGNHLPDWVIARPVFVEGRLCGFTCNRAHQSDIGGGAAGTYNPEATEIFHEGIRLPPLKLVEQGKTREDLWKLLLINSRTSDALDGDLRAMIGSCRIGGERVAALVQELGTDEALQYFEGVLSHADRRFRAAVAELPDGRYEALEYTDGDCFEQMKIAIRVAVTIDGDGMTVDFTGSDPQIRGFKNSSVANTWSAVYMALASFFDPDIPRNEGTFRGVQIIAPEGTIVNARPPAPMTMNTVFVAHEIVVSVWKALGQAAPKRSLAGWGKTIMGLTSSREGRTEPFVMYHWNAASGGGAVNGRDGFSQIGHLITLGGLTLANLESYEQLYPMVFHKQELRVDAAGAGKFRGGPGVDYEVHIQVPANYSFRGEGIVSPTGFGEQGGGTGAKGEMTLHLDSGEVLPAPQYGNRRYEPLTLKASSPAGGGWGNPLQRDPALVLADVRNGILTREAAARDYGVVLQPNTWAIDDAATQQRRTG